MLRQLDGFEHIGAHRTGFNECTRLDRTNLVNGNLKNLLAFGQAHGPRLTYKASDPDAIVPQRTKAMPDKCAEGALVNVLAARSAEGRVQGVDDSSQSARCPGPGFGSIRHSSPPHISMFMPSAFSEVEYASLQLQVKLFLASICQPTPYPAS